MPHQWPVSALSLSWGERGEASPKNPRPQMEGVLRVQTPAMEGFKMEVQGFLGENYKKLTTGNSLGSRPSR